MAINIPGILQSLGAITTSFADPRQSLAMSQNVFAENQRMADLRRREEEQARKVARENALYQMKAQEFALRRDKAEREARLQEAAAERENQYRNMFMQAAAGQPYTAPGGGSPQMSPVGAPNINALPPAQQLALIAALGEDDFSAAAKALQPHPLEARANAYMRMTPEQKAADRALAESRRAQTTLVDQRGSQDFPPGMGQPEPGHFYPRDESGNFISYRRTDPATGQTYQAYRQVPINPEAETVGDAKQVALIDTGLRSLDLVETALAEGWAPVDRAAYFAGTPSTRGGAARREHDVAINNALRLQSGAEAPEKEVARMTAMYGLSAFDSLEERQAKIQGLRYYLEAVDTARKRVGGTEPLSKEDVDTVQKYVDKKLADEGISAVAGVNMPDPGPGYSFTGYNPRLDAYMFKDENGEVRGYRRADILGR